MESAFHNLQSSPMIRGEFPTAAAGSESQAREFTERNMRGYVRTTYGYAAESLPLVDNFTSYDRILQQVGMLIWQSV